jgi:tRNA threonylcarbamoyladenosine biosynthesis protein TsaB
MVISEQLQFSNMNEKPILAIETSDKLCGASVYFNNEKYSETILMLKNSHSEKIFNCVDVSLKQIGVELKDCKVIAVSSGPGSFTGLRIGLSSAKGLAMGSGLPIVLVPTFEALALELLLSTKPGDEFVIANKVNIEEIYYARFKNDGNIYKFVEDLKLIRQDELENLSKGVLVFGNVVNSNLKIINKFAPSPKSIAEWCMRFGQNLLTYEYDYLEPKYLKSFSIKRKVK